VFQQHFWLLCGLWCGVGNSLFIWMRLRKQASAGVFTPQQANTFALVMGGVVLSAMLVFWGLQLSAVNAGNPNFLTWPNPQKQLALAWQVLLWGAMVYWVFFKGGADLLSSYIGAGHSGWKHKYFFSVNAFKVMTVGTVISGVASALATLPA
jgi:hypothetical protein